MKIVSSIGAVLFIILWIVSKVLVVAQPEWYWDDFIPKLHRKENEHPVITSVVLLLLVALLLCGLSDAIIF